MNVLIFSTFNSSPHFAAVMLNELQERVNKANNDSKVFLVSCSKTFDRCGFNLFSLKYSCDVCQYRLMKGLKKMQGDFRHIKLQELFKEEDIKTSQNHIQRVGSINRDEYFDDFDYGEAVLSSYISKTRDKDLEEPKAQELLKKIAENSILVYLSIVRFIEAHDIGEVILFNGRWDYYKAAMKAAAHKGVKSTILEYARPGGYINVFDNSLPHNIQNLSQRYLDTWERSTLDQEEKERIAKQYFEFKRFGNAAVGKSYIDKQKADLVPNKVDFSKKTVVLYTSSEDEFAAVGDEYRNPFFGDQNEGIRYVINLFKEKLVDMELVVRMHPNQAGLPYAYAQEFDQMKETIPNVHIISPTSSVDSYALMDKAYKLITFGSSIGVEASFWQKPVVLLGRSYYSYSDVVYTPQSKDDIANLIVDPLPLKPVENALKIGFFYIQGGEKATYYHSKDGDHFFKEANLSEIDLFNRVKWKLEKKLKIKN
ncbi:MAG: hypothetical protein AAF363_14235 [Bacteroidota bacterium]